MSIDRTTMRSLVEAANAIGESRTGDRYDDMTLENLRLDVVAKKLQSVLVDELASSGGPKIEVDWGTFDYDPSVKAEFGIPAPDDRSFGDEMTLSIQLGSGYFSVKVFHGREMVSREIKNNFDVRKPSDYIQAIDPFVKKYMELLNAKKTKGVPRKAAPTAKKRSASSPKKKG